MCDVDIPNLEEVDLYYQEPDNNALSPFCSILQSRVESMIPCSFIQFFF